MRQPIRRELDVAQLAARERRLRLVMQILSARQAESERAGAPPPAALRQSIADFGQQLRDVHRRQAELDAPPQSERSTGQRTDRFDRRAISPAARRAVPPRP